MFELDDCVGFITNKAAKQLSDAFNEKLSQYGITRVQWIALYFLGESDDINQSELAEKMNIKNSTMVRLIDRMEKDELVQRIKHKDDRRITYVTLTEQGLKQREELMPFGECFSSDATKNISEEDIETFKKVLQQMILNVG